MPNDKHSHVETDGRRSLRGTRKERLEAGQYFFELNAKPLTVVRESLTASLDEHLEAEAVSIAAQADLPETQDRLAAFLGRSK